MRSVRVTALVVVVIAAVLAGCGEDAPPCNADVGATPLVTGDAPLESITLGRDDDVLVARVITTDGEATSVLIDADDDRDTGMWSQQSPISASGWDVLVDHEGAMYRHDGEPTEWAWDDVDGADDGSGWTSTDDGVRVCIGPEVATRLGVASDQTLRISAITEDASLPATFLPGAAWPSDPVTQPEEPAAPVAPQSLAFAYGYEPWSVGGCTTPECAAERYVVFDHVVLGSGFEEATHPSHGGAAALAALLRDRRPDAELWGYVSLVGGPAGEGGRRDRIHTPADIGARAALWQAMGVTGVFLDEADLCRPDAQQCALDSSGDEVAITRAHQNAAIDAIHALGLRVFANGYAPEDIVGEVGGVPSSLRADDVYLLENPTFAGGVKAGGVDADAARARYLSARRLTTALGVRLAAVDTFDGAVADKYRTDPRWAEARAAVPAATIHGITNATYSATPDLADNLATP